MSGESSGALPLTARPLHVALLAGLLLSLLASASYLLVSSIGAGASHDGGMDIMALDFDPTGNAPTSLGGREDCAIIANNGIIDADEESVDAVEIDITATGVPAATAMVGFAGGFFYNESALTLQSANAQQMLAANSGSNLFNASDSLPDTNGDGTWNFAVADLGSGAAEDGSGVLMRLVLKADAGAPAAAYPVTINNTAHVDEFNGQWPPDQLLGGNIAIDAACPGVAEVADVAVSSVILAAPASAIAGEPFILDGSVVLHNAGPLETVNVDATAILSVPGGCTVTQPIISEIPDVSLPLSTNVTINGAPVTWDAVCESPGTALFSLTAIAVVDSPNVIDPAAENNAGNDDALVAVTAVADIKMTSMTATAPANKTAGTAFWVNASAVLHNNGPFGPAKVDGGFNVSPPPGCFVLPNTGVRPVNQVSVPVSSGTPVAPNAGWYAQCDQPGTYVFTVSANFALNQNAVTDPNTGNSAGSAQTSTVIKVPACGPDPAPAGDVLQNMSPLLLTLIGQLTDDGSMVPEDQRTPLDCSMQSNIHDPVGAQIDDCKVGLLAEEPCTLSLSIAFHDPAGEPLQVPTARLLPIGVLFISPSFDIAGDLEVQNGSIAGSGSFQIRTDGGLTAFGTPCIVDAVFPPAPGMEGGILPNVADSNVSAHLLNPHVWPNDLNAERAAVETALNINPLIPIALHSRVVVDLFSPTLGMHIPYNILIWRISDPLVSAATGGEYVGVGFPSDALNPDPPGPSGGNPDADDPIASPLATCAPNAANITLNGMAGSAVYVACTQPGSPMNWSLMDPDAKNFTGDDGPRSDISRCSVDLDNDGLTENEETHFGTDPLNPDSDADGIMDGPDNCPATANPGQADYDSDNIGDSCDPDVDGDGAANTADLCPDTVVGAPADASGCSQAQVDADADGVCNPAAPSAGPEPGCTGTDICPGTAVSSTVDAAGCSQAQVDADADGACDPGAPSGGPGPCTGTDNCPVVSNPGQENLDGDAFGDACDTDDDGDGVADVAEAGCGSDPMDGNARPERTDGTFAGVDDDGDTTVDEALPSGSGAFDCDGDGYTGATELSVFGIARDQDPCGTDAWSSDFSSGGIPQSTNRVTITDLTSFIGPVRRLNTSPGDGGFSARWDLVPGPGIFNNHIVITDLTALLFTDSGNPPMFGGARAFNGPACLP